LPRWFAYSNYSGQVAAGEKYPSSGILACVSGSTSANFPGNVGYLGQITQVQANMCLTELQVALHTKGAMCGAHGFPV